MNKEEAPEDYQEFIRKEIYSTPPQPILNKIQWSGTISPTLPEDDESKVTIKELPDYHYSEDELFEELQEYVDATYGKHYSSKIQTTEFIMDHCENFDFLKGNVIKYVDRYGKKNGYNRDDLLKAFHYILFMLHYDKVRKAEGRIK